MSSSKVKLPDRVACAQRIRPHPALVIYGQADANLALSLDPPGLRNRGDIRRSDWAIRENL
ncbi:MAG: hypothetical protein EBE86_031765 [Hormoscilla sp. GUM202]|nr:hypothetical protein [Hormoscilla sp. GUM202]